MRTHNIRKPCAVWVVLAFAPALTLADTQPDDAAKSWRLEQILVTGRAETIQAPLATTATRTATAVERVPQSIQVLNRTLLEEQELQTISDALVNVSGVVPSRTLETVLQSPLIRGFAVNYYFDGLPTYGLPTATSDPATLINTDRIEVAKGPSSTLYGGGTGAPLSGLLNIVSRDPDAAAGGSIGLRGGRFDARAVDIDASLPIAGERVALRFGGMYEDADSHIDVLDSRRRALFPTLAWNLSPDTRLVLRGQFNRLEQREYSGLPAELTVAPGLLIDRHTFAGAEDAPRTVVENAMTTLSLTHRLAGGAEFALAVRRHESSFDEYATFPLAPIEGTLYAFGSGYVPSEVEKTFATASLLSELGSGSVRHQVLVGVDIDRTDYFGGMGLDLAWGLVDYAAPATNAPFGSVPELSDLQNDDLRSSALFVQDQISIGERLDITAGLRWTQLDARSLYTSGGIPFADTDERYHELSPRLGATWQLTPGLALFGGHARGFQGVVAAFGVAEPNPETSIANEIGLKLARPDAGLSGTLALYEIARRNVITADPLNPGFSIQTGEQRARGFESDLVYEPVQSVSLLFSYAYTDAEVTRDEVLPEGDRLRRVPKHSGRVAGRYRFSEGWMRGLELGGGVTAVSSRELTLPNTVAVGGQALWDLQAAKAFERFTLSLSLLNLFDRAGFEPYQYFGGAFVAPTQPRSAYLTLRTEF
jgi:iron complex outermembrane receptor protein